MIIKTYEELQREIRQEKGEEIAKEEARLKQEVEDYRILFGIKTAVKKTINYLIK